MLDAGRSSLVYVADNTDTRHRMSGKTPLYIAERTMIYGPSLPSKTISEYEHDCNYFSVRRAPYTVLNSALRLCVK